MEELKKEEIITGVKKKKNLNLPLVFLVAGLIILPWIGFLQFNKIQSQEKLILHKTEEAQALKLEEANLKNKIIGLDNELTALNDFHESFKKSEESLRQKAILEIENKLNVAQGRLAEIEKEKSTIQDELNQAKSELEKKKPDKKELARLEKERLNQERQQRKDEERKLKIMAQEQIAKLNDEIGKLRNWNSHLQSELKQANRKAGELDKTTKALKDTQDNLEKLNRQLIDVNAENKALSAKLADLKQQYLQMENKSKELYFESQDVNNAQVDSARLQKLVGNMHKERIALEGEIARLKQQNIVLEQGRAGLYREIGIAYMQGKLYDLAIDAFLKSLQLDPRNPDSHYRLGLLYKYSRNNTKKSVYHFKRYLELNPDCSNKKEVQYLIQMLSD